MDASVFIANKKVFWAWILTPLVARFIAVSATYGLTVGYLDHYEQEKAYVAVVGEIQPELNANNWVLKRFAQSKAGPVNERFYQLIADRNREYDCNLNAVVNSDRSKDPLVVKYELGVNGDVDSVYTASAYLADILSDPLTSMQHCRLSVSSSRRKADSETKPSISLNAEFERLAFFQTEGGGE